MNEDIEILADAIAFLLEAYIKEKGEAYRLILNSVGATADKDLPSVKVAKQHMAKLYAKGVHGMAKAERRDEIKQVVG